MEKFRQRNKLLLMSWKEKKLAKNNKLLYKILFMTYSFCISVKLCDLYL